VLVLSLLHFPLPGAAASGAGFFFSRLVKIEKFSSAHSHRLPSRRPRSIARGHARHNPFINFGI
jgi:hypothetical protein